MGTGLTLLMQGKRYKPMIRRCVCLSVAGTALQLLAGPVNPSFLTYPWGVVLALNYLYLLILLRTNADQWKWVQQWCDRPTYITSLASMLLLTLLFGMIRQDGSTEGWTGLLGFTQMSRSWIFNLFLFQFMTAVGLKAVDDVHHWRKRNLANVIMHASFFIVLAASIFGSGDKTRVRVTAALGMPETMGVTEEGIRTELPFALTLKEFVLDEYPPHLHRFHQEKLSPEFISIEGEGSQGALGNWQVECLEFLEYAGRLTEDSAYQAMNHVGATSAIRLKAYHPDTRHTVEGWVSCGSHIFAGSALLLPDGSQLVMPRREVKKFLSKIEVMTEDGKQSFDISVNHPATVGPWKIYQSGYDSTRGRWSTISILECVKDGWYTATHIAMWMILIAAATMFIKGRNGRQHPKEDNV